MRCPANLIDVLAKAETLLQQKAKLTINIYKSADGQWAVKKKKQSLTTKGAKKEQANVNSAS